MNRSVRQRLFSPLPLLGTILLLSATCAPSEDGREPTLLPLPSIETADLDETVRDQIAELRVLAENADASRPSPESADTWGALAETYHAYEMTRSARVAYQNATLLDPDAARWWYLLGHLELAALHNDEAAEAFARALDLAAGDARTLRSAAVAERNRGDLARSAELARSAIEAAPNDAAAWLALAETETELGNLEEALEAYVRCLELQPTASRVRTPMAGILRQLGRVDDAGTVLELAGSTPVSFRDPLLEAVANRRLGYRAAIVRGQQAFQQGRFAEAVHSFREALEEQPESTEARMALGNALLRSGEVTASVENLARVVEVDSANAPAWLNYGSALIIAGETDSAIESLGKAIEIDPDYWLAHRQLAELLCAQKQWEQAIPHFERVLQINPNDERARAVGGVCLVQAGRYLAARDWVVQSLEELPSSLAIAGLAARIFAAAPEAAVRDGSRAFSISTELVRKVAHPYHREILAMAFAETGDFEAAVAEAEIALSQVEEQDPTFALLLQDQIDGYRQSRPWREPGDRLVFLR